MSSSNSFEVPGLDTTVEILLDRWGIAHIYARSRSDLFLAQGFNAARERLWQMDLWRKRGLGELARDLGPAFLDQDQATRLLLYRQPLDGEWSHYGADTRATLDAFTTGINAYVSLARSDPAYLPLEFGRLDYLPDFWRAEDMLRIRSHCLVQNVISEVERARIARLAGLEADRLRVGLQPAWQSEIPAGLELEQLPDNLLDTYLLATSGVGFSGDQLAALTVSEGSNNWVIAAEKSSTGRPIFCNDPHRSHSAPGLRYIVHLSAPGLDVAGAGQPYLPGISTGHNGHVSFGFTVFQVDQEDLYVYDLNPEDPDQYRYRDEWESMWLVEEEVLALGRKPTKAVHRFTRHGPVIHIDPARRKAYALRTVLLEPGAAPYLASLAYLEAADWEQFRDALRRWHAPSLSFVGADTAGNIGWSTSGLAPVRPNWDGLLPVPGDGRYEWDGFLDPAELPAEINPARGWVGSANQMSLPSSYPHQLGFEWGDPARYHRLCEYFEQSDEVSPEDCRRLQNEVMCIPARRLCALLTGLTAEVDVLSRALEMLDAWDHCLDADSPAAALFEIWFARHLCPAVVELMVPAEATSLIDDPDTRVVLEMLETPSPDLGQQPALARDDLLRSTLLAAVKETEGLLGDDWSGWAWGRLHTVTFEHALAKVADKRLLDRLNVGPYPVGGSDLTLNKAAYRSTDFGVTRGPSWRIVTDVGNWDDCWVMNVPGQSGNPSSPHYRDLAAPWLAGEYVRLPYTRAAVGNAVCERIVLKRS